MKFKPRKKLNHSCEMKYYLVRQNFIFVCLLLFVIFPKGLHNAEEQRESRIHSFLSWAFYEVTLKSKYQN